MADAFIAHGGAIRLYFEALRVADARYADRLEAEILHILRSDDGIKLLDMLTKSIIHFSPDLGVDDRALREIHGQRHLVAELRQMVAHGIRRADHRDDD